YLSTEELRTKLEQLQRVELRMIGRAAAEVDQVMALDAEEPTVQLVRARNTRAPLFLFPIAQQAAEVDWKTQSALKYHGRLANLASDLNRARENGTTTMFVMPTLGVAERVTEILGEYEIEARLASVEEATETVTNAQTIVTVGKVSSGFEMPGAQLLVHVEADLFDEAGAQALERRGPGAEGGRQKAVGRKKRFRSAAFLSDFRDLKPAD